jgi:hypothetical protein
VASFGAAQERGALVAPNVGSAEPSSSAGPLQAAAGIAAVAAFGGFSSRREQQRARKQKKRNVAMCDALMTNDGIPVTPVDRALAVNLSPDFYGSFAEIGAGQEVSRWFLRAGAAAGTVARTVSAYDMQMSDMMYGAAKRYVTRERMDQMLNQEYKEIEETLRSVKGKECRFFTFASTIAAKAFNSDRECEGWLGLLYQKHPGEEPSKVWVHTRMSDPTAQLQADALGVLGANMVYLCSDPERSFVTIIKHLLDDVGDGVTINWIDFSGPGWEDVDDRHVAFYLVQYRLAEAVVFDPLPGKHQRMQPTVPNLAFYKRPVLVQRGRFRFISKVNEVIFDASVKKLKAEREEEGKDPLPVIEMNVCTIGNSAKARNADIPPAVVSDFCSRFNVLSAMRTPILISGLDSMHKLMGYMQRYTNQKVVVAVGGGSYSIERGIFRDSECEGLSGGLLEAFGKIFAKDAQMYVFPNIADDGTITSGVEPKSPDIAKNTLLTHLKATGRILPIEEEYIKPEVLSASTNEPYRGEVQEVLNMLCRADQRWTALVPELVVETVKKKGISEVLGTLECALDKSANTVSPLERFHLDFQNS